MKIKELKIEGVGGIQMIDLAFNPQMNIICGPNGIGKTTILESAAHLFSAGSTSILKRNVKSEKSRIFVQIEENSETQNKTVEFDVFTPEKQSQINGLYQLSNKVLSLKTSRLFGYQPLVSVSKDTKKEQHVLYNDAKQGIGLGDIKNWFVNRYLYSKHETLSKEQLNNFELAKTCFSFLNKNFIFSKVDASSNEIMVNTPSGEIYYEYLSSGFKSILSVLFGIIKEIEYRFSEPNLNAVDFDGIILIDELELHLHPEWQGKISAILTKAFPKAQFITTTHSPHIIQGANFDEIIALGFSGQEVVQRELPKSEFGFKGWTIEEVLTDVMGMKDTRTEEFNSMIIAFEKYVDSNNYTKAKEKYEIIDRMIHPQNHLRKLLRFQLAAIKEDLK